MSKSHSSSAFSSIRAEYPGYICIIVFANSFFILYYFLVVWCIFRKHWHQAQWYWFTASGSIKETIQGKSCSVRSCTFSEVLFHPLQLSNAHYLCTAHALHNYGIVFGRRQGVSSKEGTQAFCFNFLLSSQTTFMVCEDSGKIANAAHISCGDNCVYKV